MLYLADKHDWESWCPKDLKIRARVSCGLESMQCSSS